MRRSLGTLAGELARRRVPRAMITYAVAAFGTLQGLDVMVNRLDLPGAWMRAAVLAALAGLPVTAVLAWMFDWTSAGVVRTAPAEGPAQASPARQRVALVLSVGALLAVIALVAVRDHRYRSARAALDEAARLADTGRLAEAFALARRAEPELGASPALERVLREVARPLKVTTTPAGATVEVLEWDDPTAEWQVVGQTPLAGAAITVLPVRLRISRPGYLTEQRAVGRAAGSALPAEVELTLHAEGTVPEGFVPIPGNPMSWVPLVALENVSPGELGEAWLGRTEVTNAEFRRFVAAGGYRDPAHWSEPFVDGGRKLSFEEAKGRFRDRTGRPGPGTWSAGDFPEGQGELPVGGVSWYEAAAYAHWAGGALPTLYHWARAATPGAAPQMVPRSNFNGAGPNRVGTGEASGYGLHDMAGNVKEWCWNASGELRYLLGGGFGEPVYMFNDADAQSPWAREPNFGLRLVRYPTPPRPGLLAPLTVARRDYANERPVDDAAFRIYAGLYRYDRAPLDPRAERVEERERWRVERVSFAAAYGGERVGALLYTPRDVPPPWQLVAYFPGSGALHQRSSEDLATYPFDFHLRAGRAVLHPIYKSTYERGDGLVSDNQDTSRSYRDHVIMWAQDLSRSLDWAETRPDLDHAKIALQGVSWGGAVGPLLAAVEPRIAAMVLVSGGLEFQQTSPEADPFHFAPRARQPALMVNGRYDFYFSVERSQQPLFAALGAPPERKRHVVTEGGHAVAQDVLVREATDWLDRWLGPVR